MSETVRFLVGENVYLRPIEPSDLQRCQLWINDPQVRRYLLAVFPFDQKAEQAWHDSLHRSPPPASVVLAIILSKGDRHVGNTGFVSIDWVNRVAETGTMIGELDCWGKGVAFEAKQLLLDYGFNTLGLHRIQSRTLAPNHRSRAHLLRSGYREEGRRLKRHFREGAWHDEVLFGLLREDWNPETRGAG